MSHPISPLLLLQLFEFSIPEKQYTDWSRTVQKSGLHKVWLERDSPITHITFNPRNPSHILLHDIYMFCIIDKSLVSLCAQARGLGLFPGHRHPLAVDTCPCWEQCVALVSRAVLTRAVHSS